mmetsp:Transcript_97181/g.272011  ORF Transcript_97181/g.272011 Transcript_97181/m.272011 type:complete len:218 (-) Transcript_97181:239-892(-)
MHHTFAVDVPQGAQHLLDGLGRRLLVELAAICDSIEELTTAEVLEDQCHTALCLVNIEQPANMRVVQAQQDLDLVDKGDAILRGGVPKVQLLDGDLLTGVPADAQEDFAVGADAQHLPPLLPVVVLHVLRQPVIPPVHSCPTNSSTSSLQGLVDQLADGLPPNAHNSNSGLCVEEPAAVQEPQEQHAIFSDDFLRHPECVAGRERCALNQLGTHVRS